MKKMITHAMIILVNFYVSTAYAGASNKLKSKLEEVKETIVKNIRGVKPENIFVSQIPGLYQIVMPPRLFYASADGRYIIDGDMIDMKNNHNVTQAVRDKALITAVDDLGEDSMIIFGKDTLKHTVTVFTDIDCGYCRKLHSEIKNYNKEGIRIRYLSYPRAGLDSDSAKKADAVWCSKNKQQALTDAKNGKNVESEKCNSPVAKHYALGNMIGLRGTPAIVLENGTVVPGYIPAKRLSEALNRAEINK